MSSYNVLTGNTTYLSAISPVGSLAAYLGSSDPPGWVICDGTTRYDNTYGKYNTVASLGIGSGGGGTADYTPPDYRGAFLRGIGTSSANSNYVGPTTLGSYQDQQMVNHGHAHSSHNHNTFSNLSGATGITNGRLLQITNTGCEDAFSSNVLLVDTKENAVDMTSTDPGTGTAQPESNGPFKTTDVDVLRIGNEIRPYNYGVNWILKL
jgi:microcystin-dependent protein